MNEIINEFTNKLGNKPRFITQGRFEAMHKEDAVKIELLLAKRPLGSILLIVESIDGKTLYTLEERLNLLRGMGLTSEEIAVSPRGETAETEVTEEDTVSSEIRNLLGAGKIEKANSLLGRQFHIEGKIAHGQKIGRRIGFPTANISVPEGKILPAQGVYTTKIEFAGKTFAAVTNVGERPTVDDKTEITVETHIPGFSGDIYGEPVLLRFCRFLRKTVKFESIELLKEQIKKDIENI